MIEKRAFGKTGLHVGMLGLGAAEIGFDHAPEELVDRILSEAIDAGVNVIDTAAMYVDSEKMIGRALRGRREHFLLFTKCGAHLPPASTFAGFVSRAHRTLRAKRRTDRGGLAYWHDPFYWDPAVLKSNIEQSLIRMKTDRFDLIQLHSCSEEILRRGDVIDVLHRAREAGKARYIGYSGDGQAALYAIRCGQFDALQTSINIADQEAIDVVVPLVVRQGMGLIAKRPIANGIWRNAQKPDSSFLSPYWERLQELQYDWLRGRDSFEKALRFTLSVPGVSTAIVGTSHIAHFRQNVEFAMAGALEDWQFDAIRSTWKRIARPGWIGQT